MEDGATVQPGHKLFKIRRSGMCGMNECNLCETTNGNVVEAKCKMTTDTS